MNLLVKDGEYARCAVELIGGTANVQFKQHPNVAKFAPGAAAKVGALYHAYMRLD